MNSVSSVGKNLLDVTAFFDAEEGGWEQDEDQVDQDADDGSEDDSGNAIREKHWDFERE